MTREQLQEKSLNDLREIAKLQGVKSLTKYRKGELIDIIMNGGRVDVYCSFCLSSTSSRIAASKDFMSLYS